MSKRFRSRVSVMLVAFLVVVTLLTLILPIKTGQTPALAVGLGGLGAALLIIFGISYEINDNDLVIRIVGIKYFSVAITEIESIKRSYILLSSPAASLKRLRCNIKGRKIFSYVLISPVDEEEFLELIKRRNPNVKLDVTNAKGAWRFWDWDI